MELSNKIVTRINSVKKIIEKIIQTLGSVLVANGIPVMTTALPARSAKSNPSLTYNTKSINCDKMARTHKIQKVDITA